MNTGGFDDSIDTWGFRSIVSTMMPLLMMLSIIGLLAGFVLQEIEQIILMKPTLLILLPVMIAMGGNLGSILSSRLSTSLHLGTMSFHPGNDEILKNVSAVLTLSFTVFILLGITASGVSINPFLDIGGGLTLYESLTISLVSGLILTVLVIILSILTTYASFKLGMDPDDVTIPVVTNIGDILGVVILAAVSLAVL